MSFEYEMEPDPDFRCPACGGADFMEGPHGGISINFCCVTCRARYNDHWPFGIDRHGSVADHEMEHFHGRYIPRKQAP